MQTMYKGIKKTRGNLNDVNLETIAFLPKGKGFLYGFCESP
jgi:hypothetical protein